MRKRLLILTLMLGVTAPAARAGLDDIRAAAERGSLPAQLELGILYEFGYGMPKNEVHALAWYIAAADRGEALAVTRRDVLLKQLSPAQVEEARTLAATITRAPAPAPSAPVVPPAEMAPAPAMPPAEMPPAPAAPTDGLPPESPAPVTPPPASARPAVPPGAAPETRPLDLPAVSPPPAP